MTDWTVAAVMGLIVSLVAAIAAMVSARHTAVVAKQVSREAVQTASDKLRREYMLEERSEELVHSSDAPRVKEAQFWGD